MQLCAEEAKNVHCVPEMNFHMCFNQYPFSFRRLITTLHVRSSPRSNIQLLIYIANLVETNSFFFKRRTVQCVSHVLRLRCSSFVLFTVDTRLWNVFLLNPNKHKLANIIPIQRFHFVRLIYIHYISIACRIQRIIIFNPSCILK